MAMEEYPSTKEGQSWSSFADHVGFKNSENEEEEEDAGKEKNWKKRRENDAMKLRKEEMGLFGYCPTWDDFFLVVCELCGRVVKPQAFSGHLEYRHGSGSHSANSEKNASSSSTPQHQQQQLSRGKSGGGSGGGGGGGREGLTSSHSRGGGGSNSLPQVPPAGNRSNSSSGGNNNVSGVTPPLKSSPSSANNNAKQQNSQPPHKIASNSRASNSHSTNNTHSASANNTPEHHGKSNSNSSKGGANESSKSSKKREQQQLQQQQQANQGGNHSIDPVVRVERMPNSALMKKTSNDSPSSAHHHSNERDCRESSASPRVHSSSESPRYAPLASNDPEQGGVPRASPARTQNTQVLYEGTSGPGPGNDAPQTSRKSSSSLSLMHGGASKIQGGDVFKKSMSGASGNGVSPLSGPTSRAMSAPSTPAVLVHKKPAKSKKTSKERKQLLCKDREYDANKHCGVVIAESGKHCTRSLTCKTHSLSLRRAVMGREKNFDDLLTEHRAAKEALLKPPPNPPNQAPSSATTTKHNQHPQDKTGGGGGGGAANKGGGHPPSAVIANLKKVLASGRVSKVAPQQQHESSAPPPTSSTSNATHNAHIQRLSSSRDNILQRHLETNAAATAASCSKSPPPNQSSVEGSKNHSVQRSDLPYLSHHPRPAAMCSFGVRRMGCGVFLTNRYSDSTRSALEMAFLHRKGVVPAAQVPPKKARVETTLDHEGLTLDLTSINESNDSDASSSLASPPRASSLTNVKTLGGGVKVVTSSSSSFNNTTDNSPTRSLLTVPNCASSSRNSVLNSNAAVVSRHQTLTSALENRLGGGGSSPSSNASTLKQSSSPPTGNKSKLANAVNKLKRLKASEEKTNVTTNCGGGASTAAKKRRTSSSNSATVLHNPSVSSCTTSATVVAGGTVLEPARHHREKGDSPQHATPRTMTVTALTSTAATAQSLLGSPRSLPLSFPLTIGERLGALSRLSVPFVNRNNVAMAPNASALSRQNPGKTTTTTLVNNLAGIANHVTNAAATKDNVFLTTADVLNGQIPVSSTLLHSVTVSRASSDTPTLAGISLGHHSTAALVDQLTRYQHQQSLSDNKEVSCGAKGGGTSSSKYKSRKSRSHQHSQSASVKASSASSTTTTTNRGPYATAAMPLNLGVSLLQDEGAALQIYSGSSPTDSQSPQLRLECGSPGVSSPMVNGRGVSPSSVLPPLFAPNKNANATFAASQSLSASSSPDCNNFTQHPTTTTTTKGKSKHGGSSYAKAVTPLNVVAAAAQQHAAAAAAAAAAAGNIPLASPSSSITYQQVFASQMLTAAQLNQFGNAFHSSASGSAGNVVVPSNKNHKKGGVAAANIPLKLLATSSSSGGHQSGGPQRRHLLLADDSRRKDLQQDTHSLST